MRGDAKWDAVECVLTSGAVGEGWKSDAVEGGPASEVRGDWKWDAVERVLTSWWQPQARGQGTNCAGLSGALCRKADLKGSKLSPSSWRQTKGMADKPGMCSKESQMFIL